MNVGHSERVAEIFQSSDSAVSCSFYFAVAATTVHVYAKKDQGLEPLENLAASSFS